MGRSSVGQPSSLPLYVMVEHQQPVKRQPFLDKVLQRTIKTDATLAGWGAQSQHVSVQGLWTPNQ